MVFSKLKNHSIIPQIRIFVKYLPETKQCSDEIHDQRQGVFHRPPRAIESGEVAAIAENEEKKKGKEEQREEMEL